MKTNDPVRKMVEEADGMFIGEKAAVLRALDAGEEYGYGNIMSWLATAWAVRLRDQGIPENAAVRAARFSTYPLPPVEETKQQKQKV